MIPSSKQQVTLKTNIWMAESFWMAGSREQLLAGWDQLLDGWDQLLDDQLQPPKDREKGRWLTSWSIHSINYKTRRCDRIMIER